MKIFAFLFAAVTFFPPIPQQFSLVNRVGFSGTSVANGSYTTLASPSLALGVSSGPTGAWDVEVVLQPGSNTAAVSYGCIIGTNAGSSASGNYDATDSVVCHGSPANALAGNLNSNISLQVKYSAQYANNTTVSFTCKMQASTNGNNAYGSCVERAWPI
jgi:hypothetical protein